MRVWNSLSLDDAIKAATTPNSFKCAVKKLMFKNTAGRYYNRLIRKSSIDLRRIRLGLSTLKHQHSWNCVSYAIINMMKCHCIILWNVQNRRPADKTSSLGCMDRLDTDISNTQSVTDLITPGHTTLSVYDNVALVYTVQEHLTKTKRF